MSGPRHGAGGRGRWQAEALQQRVCRAGTLGRALVDGIGRAAHGGRCPNKMTSQRSSPHVHRNRRDLFKMQFGMLEIRCRGKRVCFSRKLPGAAELLCHRPHLDGQDRGPGDSLSAFWGLWPPPPRRGAAWSPVCTPAHPHPLARLASSTSLGTLARPRLSPPGL